MASPLGGRLGAHTSPVRPQSSAGDEPVPGEHEARRTGSPRGRRGNAFIYSRARPGSGDDRDAQLAQSRSGSSSLGDVVRTPTCEPRFIGETESQDTGGGSVLGSGEASAMAWSKAGAEQGRKPRPLLSSLASPSREVGLSSLLSTDWRVAGGVGGGGLGSSDFTGHLLPQIWKPDPPLSLHHV